MTLGCKTSKDVMKAIKDHGVQMIDIRFTDMPGMWQHTSYPTQVFEQDAIDDGLGFDGSSIRGFKVINESDMLLLPDLSTAPMRSTSNGSTVSTSTRRSSRI